VRGMDGQSARFQPASARRPGSRAQAGVPQPGDARDQVVVSATRQARSCFRRNQVSTADSPPALSLLFNPCFLGRPELLVLPRRVVVT
jgi:hypothetical protein